MERDWLALTLTIVGTACWGICFAWMHQISSKQSRLLDQLRDQSQRIEKLSKEEHDLIRDVHPQVGEIRESIEEVKDAVDEKKNEKPARSRG